jgi:hypothetical protein
MKTETAIGIAFLGVMVAIGVHSGVDAVGARVLEYQHRADQNKRGWIGCENGTMWAKNIDIDNLTFDMPEGHYLFDIDGRYCKQKAAE